MTDTVVEERESGGIFRRQIDHLGRPKVAS